VRLHCSGSTITGIFTPVVRSGVNGQAGAIVEAVLEAVLAAVLAAVVAADAASGRTPENRGSHRGWGRCGGSADIAA
jgi:hypothetical protein